MRRRAGSRDAIESLTRRLPAVQGPTRLPPIALPASPKNRRQDRLPTIPAIPSPRLRNPTAVPFHLPDESRLVRPGNSTRVMAAGGLARRRSSRPIGEKLQPIGGNTPSHSRELLGPQGPNLSRTGLGLTRPPPWALPVGANADSASSDCPGRSPNTSISQPAVSGRRRSALDQVPPSPSSHSHLQSVPQNHPQRFTSSVVDAPAVASGVAKPSVAQQADRESRAKNAAKAQAVASLHKLFYEEVERGCDPNQAAANALLRLAEAGNQAVR